MSATVPAAITATATPYCQVLMEYFRSSLFGVDTTVNRCCAADDVVGLPAAANCCFCRVADGASGGSANVVEVRAAQRVTNAAIRWRRLDWRALVLMPESYANARPEGKTR